MPNGLTYWRPDAAGGREARHNRHRDQSKLPDEHPRIAMDALLANALEKKAYDDKPRGAEQVIETQASDESLAFVSE